MALLTQYIYIYFFYCITVKNVTFNFPKNILHFLMMCSHILHLGDEGVGLKCLWWGSMFSFQIKREC